jgi:hypothetical protein
MDIEKIAQIIKGGENASTKAVFPKPKQWVFSNRLYSKL